MNNEALKFCVWGAQDNSAYLHMKDNVLLYGHFLKSDYSGHSIEFEGDLSVFGGPSNQYQAVPPAFPNSVHDSVMISKTDGDILFQEVCPNETDWPKVYNIKLYSPTAHATVCGQPLAYWQAQGKLANVTQATLPKSSALILSWARQTLGMPAQGSV